MVFWNWMNIDGNLSSIFDLENKTYMQKWDFSEKWAENKHKFTCIEQILHADLMFV